MWYFWDRTYDLELDFLTIEVDGTDHKVNTYRPGIAFRVGILGEP